jgi:hypothetical protein
MSRGNRTHLHNCSSVDCTQQESKRSMVQRTIPNIDEIVFKIYDILY